MYRRSGPPQPAPSEDTTKIVKTQFTGSDVGITRGNCPFCGAPALKPNRRERRQHRSNSVPWVMQHAVWCRFYGDGLGVSGPPRPNGGAA
jgi:hypothetical protein